MVRLDRCTSIGARAFFFLVCAFIVSYASAQVAPPLGQAGSFVVLAGSTVTNSGPTNVLGDVGVSPGSAVVGFPPGVVSGGTIHSNDPVALSAQNDAATAYNTLAGEASTATLTGQDLGGRTLHSGVYVFSTSAQLTGTLTLDAQNDPGAVFVFQIGSSLTTASGSRVVVINGGMDCNVFWQVGSSATFGTTTQFVGNILAMASITFNTGSSVSGRALARTGAVTMDTNDATICSSCGVLTIAPAALLPMTMGTPYSQTLTASGGTAPYSFAVMGGALPPGISLTPAGTLSGTPTASGSFSFSVRATDALGCVGDVSYTVIVTIIPCGTITVAPAALLPMTMGTPYSQTLTASGGTAPYSFAVMGGALPPGISLTSAGTLSGTPTASGSFSFTVRATDALGCLGEVSYTVIVTIIPCGTITVSPANLVEAVPGTPYLQVLTASGGVAPYTFTIGSGALPSGLNLAADGTISGTTTATGSFTFTVIATDSAGCPGSRSYTLLVQPIVCTALSMTPLALGPLTMNVPFSQVMGASGGTAPYTFTLSAGQLPAGLAMSPASPSSATLAGIPGTPANYSFTLLVTDSAGCFGSNLYQGTTTGTVAATSAPTLSLWSELGLLVALVAAAGWSANRVRRSRPQDPMR